MPDKYDTAEIRVTARRVLAAANEVGDLSSRNLRQVIANLDEGFKGIAADALNTRLEEVSVDITGISRGLENVYRELMDFARRLDAADREIENRIAGS